MACLPFRCWDKVLSADSLQSLEAEARALWDLAGGPREDAVTFWIGKADQPHCSLERLALAIARAHFPAGVKSNGHVFGCEFWVQLRRSVDSVGKRGLEFHYD